MLAAAADQPSPLLLALRLRRHGAEPAELVALLGGEGAGAGGVNRRDRGASTFLLAALGPWVAEGQKTARTACIDHRGVAAFGRGPLPLSLQRIASPDDHAI